MARKDFNPAEAGPGAKLLDRLDLYDDGWASKALWERAIAVIGLLVALAALLLGPALFIGSLVDIAMSYADSDPQPTEGPGCIGSECWNPPGEQLE